MAPTVFREQGFRFYFFSREEPRMHVHVQHADGEAKYWLEPAVSLAQNFGLSAQALKAIEVLLLNHEQEVRNAWNLHFPR